MKKTLLDFKVGDKIVIECIKCQGGFRNRLHDLGLYDGSEIKLIKNDKTGPIIIQVLNSKIALGRGEAMKIYGETK